MMENTCMDCGMLMPPHTTICPVCGFDNNIDPCAEHPVAQEFIKDYYTENVPEEQPGF